MRHAQIIECRGRNGDMGDANGRSRGGGAFWTGFLVGGAVFGALGFLFAPQISKVRHLSFWSRSPAPTHLRIGRTACSPA